ncbi:MAG TPA: hypothetical protein VIV11_16440 [Kofleriaceae bacterium]
MRTVGLGVVIALSLTASASAEIFRTHVHGTAAIASFSDVSADGCVETTGTLAAASSTNGTFAIVVAERWDYCAPDGPAGSFYAGGGDIAYSGNGLSSASASGTVVAEEYTGRGLPPLTVEFELAFSGTGAVTATTSRFASGGGGTTVSFTSSRSRNANIGGSISLDGDAATASGGQLVAEVAGELVVVH